MCVRLTLPALMGKKNLGLEITLISSRIAEHLERGGRPEDIKDDALRYVQAHEEGDLMIRYDTAQALKRDFDIEVSPNMVMGARRRRI